MRVHVSARLRDRRSTAGAPLLSGRPAERPPASDHLTGSGSPLALRPSMSELGPARRLPG